MTVPPTSTPFAPPTAAFAEAPDLEFLDWPQLLAQLSAEAQSARGKAACAALGLAATPGEAEARMAAWSQDRPAAEVGRVVAGDPEAVLDRLRALGDAGATWCALAPVGGPGAEARALLADAAGLPGREEN